MSFAIDGRNLPGIRSFADCERLFNFRLCGLTPRRENGSTWSRTVLPLCYGSRAWRDSSKRIEKGGDSYACVYHRTPVVRYFADGRIEFEASYDSQSTKIFFDAVSPPGWTICRERGYRFYYNRTLQKWHTCTRAEPLRLDVDGRVTNGVEFKFSKRLADMPRRREIRAQLKPFYAWFGAMTRVTNSIAAVVNVDAMPHGPSGRLFTSVGSLRDAVAALLQPEASEADWRYACSLVRAVVSRNVWEVWDSMSFEAKFGIEYAPLIRGYIERELWRSFGGWKLVDVVVPPGDKP